MFSHRLDENVSYRVEFSRYAEKHFLKSFRKKYKSKIWSATERSIFYDLERISNHLQFTQQVDELKYGDGRWIFKYDFAVAMSGKSPKSAGNRCICVLDRDAKLIKILLIYAKSNLPKNMSETAFVEGVLKNEI